MVGQYFLYCAISYWWSLKKLWILKWWAVQMSLCFTRTSGSAQILSHFSVSNDLMLINFVSGISTEPWLCHVCALKLLSSLASCGSKECQQAKSKSKLTDAWLLKLGFTMRMRLQNLCLKSSLCASRTISSSGAHITLKTTQLPSPCL